MIASWNVLSILREIRTQFEIVSLEKKLHFFLKILEVYGLVWERGISLRTIMWIFRVWGQGWELETSLRIGMKVWNMFNKDNYVYFNF